MHAVQHAVQPGSCARPAVPAALKGLRLQHSRLAQPSRILLWTFTHALRCSTAGLPVYSRTPALPNAMHEWG
jgi:hypothetical protein